MKMNSSNSFNAILAAGAMAFAGLTAPAFAGDSMNCDALAARLAAMAAEDPSGASSVIGATLQNNCACVIPVADAVFTTLGAGSSEIPNYVYEMARACPSQGADIAASAVAVAPGQEGAIRDALSRGVDAAGMDGGADFYSLRPIDTSGVYLIPPSAPSGASVDSRADAPTTVVTRTVTRTVGGGTRTVVVVSPSGVGG